ncbi:MAG TPA: 50S ribosomal protein L18 [Nevskiaceae bacterium]|nr:50S ribosomal protein L18 [Nevskiaceae bacterium]
MHSKNLSRLRRARRARARIRDQGAYRLTVHRSGHHIYAQVIGPDAGHTLAAASTTEKALREGLTNTSNVDAAAKVGAAVAERAKAAGISKVAFDRAGYKYHGRIKALADAARAGGLEF